MGRTLKRLDCGTYIENFLSAHADGELTGDELRAAEEHLAGCAECRARFEEEVALKKLLREHLVTLKTPAAVRDRLLAALDAAASEQAPASQVTPIRGGSRAGWIRPRVWVPAAIAALLVLGLIERRTSSPPGSPVQQEQQASSTQQPQASSTQEQQASSQQPQASSSTQQQEASTEQPQTPSPQEQEASAAGSIPMFDLAVHHFDHFQNKFEPNVPSGSPADISDAYMDHKMPGYLWNFGPAGYRLVGGRLEQLPDGRMAAFTFYRGDGGTILCTYTHAPGFKPAGAIQEMGSHAYYTYKGYSICLSKYPHGDFICLLVSRRPMPEFMETIAASLD
ncbi:MAG: anti-sigma factor family protein [Candidatus Binataceae bacterium]